MKPSNLTLALIEEILCRWCQTRPLQLCLLFGSQATGNARPDSDIDLAIWPDKPLESRTMLRWVAELEDLLAKPVNMVFVSPDLDPVLGFEIVRDGRVLYEREPYLWLKWRSRLWHAYNDSLPFRRLSRQQLQQFAEEVSHDS